MLNVTILKWYTPLSLILGLGLSFVLLASISTIFLALILWLLFIPPMVVLASIVFEGVSVISKELRKHMMKYLVGGERQLYLLRNILRHTTESSFYDSRQP